MEIDVNLKQVIIDFLYLSTFILIGTLARRYIRFFQKFLIPNNLIGGFLALIVGTQGRGWIDLPEDQPTAYIYHLLALTFIALGLRQQKTHWGIRTRKSKLIKSVTHVPEHLLLIFPVYTVEIKRGADLVERLSFWSRSSINSINEIISLYLEISRRNIF